MNIRDTKYYKSSEKEMECFSGSVRLSGNASLKDRFSELKKQDKQKPRSRLVYGFLGGIKKPKDNS